MDVKKNTVVLGLVFIILLGLSYAENSFFFGILGDVLQNQFLVVGMLFLHSVLVVSLILIGITFYVNLIVLNFFKREKYADVVISKPENFCRGFCMHDCFLEHTAWSHIDQLWSNF